MAGKSWLHPGLSCRNVGPYPAQTQQNPKSLPWAQAAFPQFVWACPFSQPGQARTGFLITCFDKSIAIVHALLIWAGTGPASDSRQTQAHPEHLNPRPEAENPTQSRLGPHQAPYGSDLEHPLFRIHIQTVGSILTFMENVNCMNVNCYILQKY